MDQVVSSTRSRHVILALHSEPGASIGWQLQQVASASVVLQLSFERILVRQPLLQLLQIFKHSACSQQYSQWWSQWWSAASGGVSSALRSATSVRVSGATSSVRVLQRACVREPANR